MEQCCNTTSPSGIQTHCWGLIYKAAKMIQYDRTEGGNGKAGGKTKAKLLNEEIKYKFFLCFPENYDISPNVNVSCSWWLKVVILWLNHQAARLPLRWRIREANIPDTFRNEWELECWAKQVFPAPANIYGLWVYFLVLTNKSSSPTIISKYSCIFQSNIMHLLVFTHKKN